MSQFQRGLDGRERDANGEIRRKNGNTLIGTIRDEYGPNVAPGYRRDAKLETVLKEEGVPSLSKLIKK